MSDIIINYPERTPINSVKAKDLGCVGTDIHILRDQGKVMIVSSSADTGRIIAELDVKKAARLFHAALTMTGPAEYEEGESYP